MASGCVFRPKSLLVFLIDVLIYDFHTHLTKGWKCDFFCSPQWHWLVDTFRTRPLDGLWLTWAGGTTVCDIHPVIFRPRVCFPNEDFGPSKNMWVRHFVRTFHTPKYSIWAKSDEKCTKCTVQNLRLGSIKGYKAASHINHSVGLGRCAISILWFSGQELQSSIAHRPLGRTRSTTRRARPILWFSGQELQSR